MAAAALAYSSLGHEVEYASPPLCISRIPVLDRRVAHVGILFHNDFHHRRVKLVLVTHRGRAAFHIAHIGTFIRHYESALELPRSLGIDAEIAGQFHRAAHTLGNVAERPVAEYSGIEGRIEIVTRRHHGGEIFPHQVGMFLHRLRE